jgi:hypothetical protein
LTPLTHLDHDETNAWSWEKVFAGIDACAALPSLLKAIDEWRPDLVLRESCELGSPVAADRYVRDRVTRCEDPGRL